MASRQYEWQLRKLAEGKCVVCGRKRQRYKFRCDACAKKERALKNRMAAEGRCIRCGSKLHAYKSLCDDCELKQRKKMRERLGYKKWAPGSFGHKPIIPD